MVTKSLISTLKEQKYYMYITVFEITSIYCTTDLYHMDRQLINSHTKYPWIQTQCIKDTFFIRNIGSYWTVVYECDLGQ